MVQRFPKNNSGDLLGELFWHRPMVRKDAVFLGKIINMKELRLQVKPKEILMGNKFTKGKS